MKKILICVPDLKYSCGGPTTSIINQINLFKSNILQKDNDNLIVSTQSNDLKKFNLLLDKYETFKDLLRKMLDEC